MLMKVTSAVAVTNPIQTRELGRVASRMNAAATVRNTSVTAIARSAWRESGRRTAVAAGPASSTRRTTMRARATAASPSRPGSIRTASADGQKASRRLTCEKVRYSNIGENGDDDYQERINGRANAVCDGGVRVGAVPGEP